MLGDMLRRLIHQLPSWVKNMSQKRIFWKTIIAVVVISIVSYSLKNLMTHLKDLLGIKAVRVTNCDLPSDLPFINEQLTSPIRIPDLPQVTPILPSTKSNKCINMIKRKHVKDLSSVEIPSFHYCVEGNMIPENVQEFYLRRLDYNITSKFFSFLKGKSDVVIIEIGGYTGQLLRRLIPVTDAKHYVVIEPVPSFYNTLNKNIKTFNFNTSIRTYNFGLSRSQKEMDIGIVGDATNLSRKKVIQKRRAKTTEKVRLVSVLDFFIQLGVGCYKIDLLTINCEGCEIDVLETLLSTNLIENFDYIQFQPHYFAPHVGNFLCRYCRLRQLLARTHEVVYNFPQVWEAWKRKQ